jgi:O-antigen/teichoic acid export membrane protein
MTVHGVILVATVISAATGLGSVLHLLIKEMKPKPYNPKIILDSFSFGKWVFGVTFLYSLFVRLDVLVIARFVDFQELGIYSTAAQIIMMLSLFTGAMSGIFLPKSIQAVTSKKRMSRYFHEAAFPVGVILILIIGLFVFSPMLIHLCFGNEYAGAVLLLRVLLIGWIFQAVYLPLQYIFYGINKTQFRFCLEIFKVISLFLLLFIMVPAFGVVGGAWAISLVYAFNFAIVSYSLFKAYRTVQNTTLAVQIRD